MDRYHGVVQVASAQQSEIQLTIEVLCDITNRLETAGVNLRTVLDTAGFPRAAKAPAAAIARLETRIAAIVPFVRSLPGLDAARANELVNEELTELTIAPAVVDHDDVGPHLHWTPATATFDDQVMADMLMALAQELCDHGTARFGQCAADGCSDLFYDGTRNNSRRFCDDPRCASRTHTADHRARKKKSTN